MECDKENLGPRSGIWNDHDVLYKGLQFENKKDLQYVVKRYCIYNNHDFVVVELEPHLWSIRCKRWDEGYKWRLHAC